MIINIGPWWLFDIFAISTIIGGLAFGLKKGFFITLYVLFLQIIALVINLFIPTLLTNLSSQFFFSLFDRTGIMDFFSDGASTIGEFFLSMLNLSIEGLNFPIVWSGLGAETLRVAIATVIFYIYSILILLIINLIGFIVYKIILKLKLQRLKISKTTDSLLGSISGFTFGLFFSMYISSIVSIPIFATETQQFVRFDFNELNEQQKLDWIEQGNSFNRYALSRKMTVNIPAVPIIQYMYTNACVQRYLLGPAATMGTQFVNQGQEGNIFEEIPLRIFDEYSSLMLNGFVSSNYLNAPLSTCIRILPSGSQTLLRIISEILLTTPRMIEMDTSTNVSSIDIMNSFESFRNYLNLSVDFADPNPNTFMSLSRFIEYFEWTRNTNNINPFLQAADFFEELYLQSNLSSDYRMSQILKNPVELYSLFRNIFINGQLTNANPNIPLFIPSVWSSSFIAQSLELTHTGELNQYFNNHIHDNWDSLNLTSRRLLTRNQSPDSNLLYNGFWMQFYFDFANLNLGG